MFMNLKSFIIIYEFTYKFNKMFDQCLTLNLDSRNATLFNSYKLIALFECISTLIPV